MEERGRKSLNEVKVMGEKKIEEEEKEEGIRMKNI